jgi:hypothetical protein
MRTIGERRPQIRVFVRQQGLRQFAFVSTVVISDDLETLMKQFLYYVYHTKMLSAAARRRAPATAQQINILK